MKQGLDCDHESRLLKKLALERGANVIPSVFPVTGEDGDARDGSRSGSLFSYVDIEDRVPAGTRSG